MLSLAIAAGAGFAMSFFGSMPPVGPIAVLVLERGVTGRYREGIGVALGAAFAESFYCAASVAGLSALMERYSIVETISRIVGVLILLGLGIHFARFHLKPQEQTESQKTRPGRLRGSFALGLTISAANPIFILTWSASVAMFLSFTRLHLSTGDKLTFVAGVFTGILTWFWIFLMMLRRFRDRITLRAAQLAVRIAGVALLCGAVWGARAVLKSFALV